MSTNRKSIKFNNSAGHKLAASIELPKNLSSDTKFVLFAHCFACSKDMLASSRISKELARKGFGVMRFDFTGLGASSGNFAHTNFSSNIQDLIDATTYLGENYNLPVILIGHSLGGAAVIASAEMIPSSRAIVTIGAPSNAKHVSHIFADKKEKILADGSAEIAIAGNNIVITKQFIHDLETHDFDEILNNLNKSILILHSPEDTVVDISEAANIYKAANHPKSFISLAGADHMLSDRKDAVYVAELIAAWASRYIA